MSTAGSSRGWTRTWNQLWKRPLQSPRSDVPHSQPPTATRLIAPLVAKAAQELVVPWVPSITSCKKRFYPASLWILGMGKQGGTCRHRQGTRAAGASPDLRHQLSHQRLICLIAPLLLPRDIAPSSVTLKQSLPLFTPAAINAPGEAAGPPHHAQSREIPN